MRLAIEDHGAEIEYLKEYLYQVPPGVSDRPARATGEPPVRRRAITDDRTKTWTDRGRAMPTATATKTKWMLKGLGYEFCNCDFGCGCNFGGFPNSKDGSCRALVGLNISRGQCGDVDLSGVKCAGIYDWPKAIHQGNGKVAFVVDPATTDKQIEALGQIFTGALGGMPWEILGRRRRSRAW